MRVLSTFSSLFAIATAIPAAFPQDIDLSLVAAAPDPIVYDPAIGATAQIVTYDYTSLVAQATAIPTLTPSVEDQSPSGTELAKRAAACTSLATGATGAPTTFPDIPAAFASNSAFAALASGAPVPSGYTNIFTNLNASNNAYGYLGFTTMQNYDTQACAAKCNAIYGCMSFNLYFERGPSVDPGSGASGCANPPSVTYIKCVFWGGPISSSNANNYGQYRNQFQVLIAGSNGYTNSSLVPPSGYSDAIYYGKAAINATYDAEAYDTTMGSKIFTGPFDANLCAMYCDAQTKINVENAVLNGASPKTCQFFNTYILYLNDTKHPLGQYCALYTEAWPSKYATNTGQYSGSNHYFVEYSYGYTNKTYAGIDPAVGDKPGAVSQASVAINASSLQPFCSAYLTYTVPSTTITATRILTPTATSTAYATATVYQRRKRDDNTMLGLTTNSTEGFQVLVDRNNVTWYFPIDSSESSPRNLKRALSTPLALTRFAPSIISSACSLQVSPATFTSTTTARVTVTGSTTTVAVTKTSKATANKFGVPTAIPTGGGKVFAKNSGTSADGKAMELQTSASTTWRSFGVFNGDSLTTSTTWHPNFVLDSSGYLRDTQFGWVLANFDYASNTPVGVFQPNFIDPGKLGLMNFAPLICAIDAKTSLLSCSLTTQGGLVLNKLMLVPGVSGSWDLSLTDEIYHKTAVSSGWWRDVVLQYSSS